jgi:hypothetical protein
MGCPHCGHNARGGHASAASPCRVRRIPPACGAARGRARCAAQVEKAPVVIKGGVAKADAENLKKLIETGGC